MVSIASTSAGNRRLGLDHNHVAHINISESQSHGYCSYVKRVKSGANVGNPKKVISPLLSAQASRACTRTSGWLFPGAIALPRIRHFVACVLPQERSRLHSVRGMTANGHLLACGLLALVSGTSSNASEPIYDGLGTYSRKITTDAAQGAALLRSGFGVAAWF